MLAIGKSVGVMAAKITAVAVMLVTCVAFFLWFTDGAVDAFTPITCGEILND